jgi:hypothetical protein
MRHARFIFFIFWIASCAPKKGSTDGGKKFRDGKKLAEVKSGKLEEVSGLAASVNNPGLLWVHNDSGNDAEIFLIDSKVDIQQTYVLAGIDNRDWEDIVVGPGPDSAKQYIYIAEIGDNEAIYQWKNIYRFEEPSWTVKGGRKSKDPEDIIITEFDTITFQLPGERKDTEALIIDPSTRDLFIFSKREEPVYIYQLPFPQETRDTTTAIELGLVRLTQIVAGDISADGNEILLKNYNHIYYWKNSSNKPLAELLQEEPLEIPYDVEPQGESIGWARDGSGFFTISEKNKGKKSFLYFYKREKQ